MIGPARYHAFRYAARALWWLYGGRLEIKGLDNVPANGAVLVFANHQSYLDPILGQAACPRILHCMAKSTQFGSPLFRRILSWLYSFPVRRFETDPQAVRQVLRRLGAGHGVIIYIEGERSWDGRLQPPRLGTVRIALKAGVPIVPCRIDGAYDAWPRWDRKIKRSLITIDFREPLHLPRLETRAEREAYLAEAADRIMKALAPR
ncbi:MAG TPA: lysophospholipid acyltransferase family protein [Longimicrobiales bacterium]